MRHGFTLIELSIVLAILGLLVGGIMGGQSLVRSSELRSVVSETNQYLTAINSFKDQYKGLPGDIPNATSYWGLAGGGSGTAAACYTTTTGDQRTCDGNGNGQITYTVTTYMPPVPPAVIGSWLGTSPEMFRAWQHLSNAGFIEGSYSGIWGTAAGVNYPRSRLARAAYQMGYYVSGINIGSINPSYIMNYGNAIQLNSTTNVRPLLASEAYTIDTKADDGLPASGTWIATTYPTFGTSTACVNSANGNDFSDATNSYNLPVTERSCGFIILMGN